MLRDELRFYFGIENTSETHIVLAVVHVLDSEQAIRNCELATKGGAHGVLLINHDFSAERFIPIVRAVRQALPELWLGINLLAV
jgi:hypothetical protein